jgi:hypothetical protein
MAFAKNDEDIKTYSLYLNLHSLYRQKTIHDFQSRYKWLETQTGLSQYMFRKYLNVLLKKRWVWIDWQGKHLQIGSPIKIMKYLELDKEFYHDEFELKWSKYIRFRRDEFISPNFLKALIVQIGERQKRFKYISSVVNHKVKAKSSKIIMETAKLSQHLANDEAPNYNLYLDDIAKIFGYTTKQASSALLATLEKDGLISKKQQFKQIGKAQGGNIQLDNKTTIKNGWLFEQVANRIFYLQDYMKETWWNTLIEKYQNKQVKEKAARCKETSKVLSVGRVLSKLNPLTASKTRYKDVFYCPETGEILHEATYYKIRCFQTKGYVTKKVYESNFKELDKGSYRVETVKLNCDANIE